MVYECVFVTTGWGIGERHDRSFAAPEPCPARSVVKISSLVCRDSLSFNRKLIYTPGNCNTRLLTSPAAGQPTGGTPANLPECPLRPGRDKLDIEQSARQLQEHAAELDRQRSEVQHQADEGRRLTDAVQKTE